MKAHLLLHVPQVMLIAWCTFLLCSKSFMLYYGELATLATLNMMKLLLDKIAIINTLEPLPAIKTLLNKDTPL